MKEQKITCGRDVQLNRLSHISSIHLDKWSKDLSYVRWV